MLCSDIGPLDAKIMLIGEAPGAEEEQTGKPFVGQAGHLLKAMCKAAGIDYNACYVTNISPERPPGNNFGYFYEDGKRSVPKESLRRCWFALNDKINRIKPRVVICLGDEPLRAVTNLRGIRLWRGSRIKAQGTTVIATYHPSAVLRQGGLKSDEPEKERKGSEAYRVIVEMDLRKAKRIAMREEEKRPKIVITIEPTLQQVIDWARTVEQDARFSDNVRVGFDIETIGTTVRSIALAAQHGSEIRSISIPFLRMINSTPVSLSVIGSTITPGGGADNNYWSTVDEEIVLEAIASILENPRISKVGQNSIHFDAPLIERSFEIKIANHAMDLMHAWHVLYPTLPKGLDFICTAICDHENYWALHDSQVDQSDWPYNAMDAAVTLEASILVDKELKNENLDKFYYTYIHRLSFALLAAERKGVSFDVKAAEEMKSEMMKGLDDCKEKLKKLIGEEVNPLSPKQVKDLLYDKLGFPKIYHHKSSKETVNEDALRRLCSKYPNEPALSLIIKYRKISKLISTYIDVLLDADGRMRCNYDVSGTITGRISSSRTIFRTGMDLHNVPTGHTPGVPSTRHLLIADPDCVFVAGDLKQAEAMVVAWILAGLGDRKLYDLYQDPSFDIHRWCAANFVYLIPENDVTKEQRQQGGKLANHSGNYMAGPGVMERRAIQMGYEGFTFRFCKEILARRTNAIPGLRVWWADVERKVKATRTLTTCFGRRIHFFGRLQGEEMRSAVAFEPQSVVADVCNKMFLALSNSDKWIPVLTTHDEVVLNVPKRYADDAAQALIDTSQIPLRLRPGIPDLVIPIEIKRGLNWRDLK